MRLYDVAFTDLIEHVSSYTHYVFNKILTRADHVRILWSSTYKYVYMSPSLSLYIYIYNIYEKSRGGYLVGAFS